MEWLLSAFEARHRGEMKADIRVSEAAVAVRFGLWSREEWYQAAEKARPLSGPSCARLALEKSLSLSPLVFNTVFGMWGPWHLLLCSWPVTKTGIVVSPCKVADNGTNIV